jgi:histidinol-phosphate aminotransferase
VAAFLGELPDRVTVILDEAYIDFQVNDDPDATADLRADFPNLVVLRTFSKVYGLAGVRVGYALCSPAFREAIDAVRQPFSVSAIAQAAGAEAIRHQDDVAQRVERTIAERIFVEEGVRDLGLQTPGSQANFSWIALGEREEGGVVATLADDGVVVRAGEPLGGRGHIRVTYGTRSDNERFLEAIGGAL